MFQDSQGGAKCALPGLRGLASRVLLCPGQKGASVAVNRLDVWGERSRPALFSQEGLNRQGEGGSESTARGWERAAFQPGDDEVLQTAGQEAEPVSGSNNHTDLHTNKQTQNSKRGHFKTESSC